ncbi:MAG: histidine kinase [Vicinamibacterales bacterium]
MTAVGIVFLVVCLFGAFAYGSSAVMALRQAAPVWGRLPVDPSPRPPALDGVSLAMFLACTVWFALNAAIEFGTLAGRPGRSLLDVLMLAVAFAFPPLIMHVVYRETGCPREPRRATPAWRWPLGIMYVVSPLAGALLVGGVLGGWRIPQPDRSISLTIACLFTLASIYSTVVIVTRPAEDRTHEQRRLGRAMLVLFALITAIFGAALLMDERGAVVAAFDRLTRTAPLMFLAVGMYFENRFEFYDLVVKRGVMLVATVAAFGVVFTLAGPWLARLPEGAVRPWLAAILVIPVAMALPWMSRLLSAWLDRLWFGRTFGAVEAVKHLLGAMQPATGEAMLRVEAERRLAEIAGAPIAVRVDEEAAPEDQVLEVEAATPSGGRVRFCVSTDPTARRLLSEDLAMLRSLASVFGFMLETIRLQQKRQEQEQIAQDLRLQSSRSELKALRAQINPHFLFNALNAIASLIHTDPARADEAVEQLAEVFRYTLRRSDSEWAPLDQELAFARAYLDVERARFGPRLTCAIESDYLPPVPQVPSMLLQTLIENAVKHGVSQSRGPGRIDVIVHCAGSDITLEVRDNGPGPGAATEHRDGEGFGLRSVRERLAGHFGDRAHLTLDRDAAAGVTIARIVMPVARVAA